MFLSKKVVMVVYRFECIFETYMLVYLSIHRYLIANGPSFKYYTAKTISLSQWNDDVYIIFLRK